MKITDLKKYKQNSKKITMITCYDHWSAQIIAQTPMDIILVGDSLAMVMHGYNSTVPATIDLMALHVSAVSKGAPNKLIIGDLPFLSYRKSLTQTMDAVEKIMQAGAHAVKLEGNDDNDTIEHIVNSGVAVFGHIGLTPQSMHALGGFTVQGKDEKVAEQLLNQAINLERKGCSAVVIECVPVALANIITDKLRIPTIGIGAGQGVDGQVLVLQDLLGVNPNFNAKYFKKYLDGFGLIKGALTQYHDEVVAGDFPTHQHGY